MILLFSLTLSPWIQAKPSDRLEPTDVFDLEYISDPQIAPDGKRVVYTRNFKDIMTDRNLSNLWIIDVDGKNNRPLTVGNHNARQARWSHDGKKIVFLSNHADDKTKLYLMWVDSKETMALTNAAMPPSQVAWSRDDGHLVFTQFVPTKKSSLLKMPAKPKGAKWAIAPIYIDDMNYRSDGRGYVEPGHNQLFMLPVDGGTPRQLTFS